MYVVSKYNPTGNQRGYALAIDDNGYLDCLLSNDGTAFTETIGDLDMQAGTEYFLAITFNTTNDYVHVYCAELNSLQPLVNHSSSAPRNLTTSIFDNTSDFRISSRGDTTQYLDGTMQYAAIFNDELSPAEIQYIYENGIDAAGGDPDPDPEEPPEQPATPALETTSFTVTSHHKNNSIQLSAFSPLHAGVKRELQSLHNFAYSHENRALGGYYKANASFQVNQQLAEEWIEYGLGRHVETYGPHLDVIWEGFVNKVTATLGPLTFSIGPLLNIGNRVKVAYSTVDYTVSPPLAGVATSTAVTNDTTSQDLYGILEYTE